MMSQQEKADPVGRLETGESPNLSRLSDLARQAFERKAAKECLDLTRAVLLIDPDNADALRMRAAIQSELHRDLDNARAFLREVQPKQSAPTESQPLAPEPSPTTPADDVNLEITDAKVAESKSETTLPPEQKLKRRPRWQVGALACVALGVVVAGLPILKIKWNPINLALLNASARSKPLIDVNRVQPVTPESNPASILVPAAPPVLISSAAFTPHQPAKLPDPLPAVVGTGTLAVSSPTSVDIYKDDVFMGSVPISLNLPTGTYALEYRHANLRKTVTYVINNDETTKAMVTFDVTVQINSRPWANVYVDGVEKKPLGQTPLGSVRVPIGSVLVFENPKFQSKKYRVIGNETGIQIVFP